MAVQETYSIRCPKCGRDQEALLYESVNVTESPELRDILMANELNAVTCEQCGFSFRVDKKLLYHDADQGIMIYWFPEGADASGDQQQQFMDTLRALNDLLPDGMDAPNVHLVYSRMELVERIFLLEAGLNERIIEYVKTIIYSRNMEQINPAEKVLLFNAEDSTDEWLCFVVQDLESLKLEGMLQFSREAYEGLSEMFDQDDQTGRLMELFPGPYISGREFMLREGEGYEKL